MSGGTSHPEALRNSESAHIPESKIKDYALVDPGKKRPFEALGFSEEAGNWKALRDAILECLPNHPATYNKENEHGTTYEVVLPIRGPTGKVAPEKTAWRPFTSSPSTAGSGRANCWDSSGMTWTLKLLRSMYGVRSPTESSPLRRPRRAAGP